MSPKKNQSNKKKIEIAHREYNKALNLYAFFKIHDTMTAQDLVQDTFTKTWVYLAKGKKIVMMKAFLYHILNNLIVDEYRKQKHKTESLDKLVEKGFEPKDEQSEHLIDFLDGKAAMEHIIELPEAYEKIMYMRFIQGMSLQDIAAITGKTKNTVSVQIHRGLQKLKVLCESHSIK